MNSQEMTLIWAQWRCVMNYFPRAAKGSLLLSSLGRLVWFGGWAFGALMAFIFVSSAGPVALLRGLGAALLVGFIYWQTVPIFVATAGMSLDLRKLLAYPIAPERLFFIEVLLRATASFEVLIVMVAVGAGLLANSNAPWWGPAAIVLFIFLNLMLSAGLRDLLTRVFARKTTRELAIFLLVIVTAVPQLLLSRGLPAEQGWERVAGVMAAIPWPWTATAHLATTRGSLWYGGALLLWCFAAYAFARFQFARSLQFDAAAAAAADRPRASSTTRGWMERFYAWPSRLFSDPLGALVEKELRFLSRAPRFRLLFIMGFTFGLIIWLPFIFDRHPNPFMTGNYLTFVSLYAILCLGDVALWNTFGFDRSAAQNYFVLPVRFGTVLVAKNLASVFFILAEIAIITSVCTLLRFPVTVDRIAEALSVTAVFTLFALGIGNLSSIYYPRSVDPGQSWRQGSGNRIQFLLLLVFPLLGMPISLAYLARYAFSSHWAFYAVLAVDLLLGAILYWVALDSAAHAAADRRESMTAALAGGEGPMSGS